MAVQVVAVGSYWKYDGMDNFTTRGVGDGACGVHV